MLNQPWIQKIEKDLKIYSRYSVLLYQYYLDLYGWVESSLGVPAHFLSIEYYDYDNQDIVVYYNARVSRLISEQGAVMVEGINYWQDNLDAWQYNHQWWDFK